MSPPGRPTAGGSPSRATAIGNYEDCTHERATGAGRPTSPTTARRFPDWQPIPYTGYPRPKGATPLRVPFVPAFKACAAPGNRTHGSPLAFPSCAPPVQESNYLTVGTPDANGAAANSVGSLLAKVKATNPADILWTLRSRTSVAGREPTQRFAPAGTSQAVLITQETSRPT